MKPALDETILVIDDNEINRYSTGRILRQAGYQTTESASGQDGLAKAKDRPALILLDVNLPDIDGFEVCRRLRSDPATADIPIVHTSATFVSDEDRIQGLELGADGYLTRPIEPRVLVATIRSFLRVRRAEDELRQREQELQSLADNTPDLIARYDRLFRHLFVNRAMERATGQQASAFLGKTCRELGVAGAFCEMLEASLSVAFESGKEGRMECWLETPAGRRRFSATLTPEYSGDSLGSVLFVARDVTEQYRAELERGRFVSLVEHSRDFIAIYDAVGKPLYINQAGMDLLGLESLQKAQQVKVRDLFRDEDRERLEKEFFSRALVEGHGECELLVHNLKTQAPHWLNCSLVVQYDELGNVAGFSAICREISEQKQLEEELRRVAADLSDANRKMNEFLATLAHELRNPMAPIRTGLEVLRIAAHDPVTVADTRAMMERQAHQMIRLIDDLLDLSRITQGKLTLRKARIDLADVLGSAVDAIRPFISEAGHTLHTVMPDTPIFLDGDPNRLTQVFANILSNASKYTKRSGTIWLTATREGNEAVISIKDNGLGIPQPMQRQIFDMFTQINRPVELGYTGLGIGLTLVKRIVEMHAGSISVISEGPNLGSEFTVRLPILETEADRQQATAGAKAKPTRRHRVLVVDDNKDSAQLLGLVLKVLGNDVRLAHDGSEAVESAREFLPSVVLMDLGMPRMDGYEAARHIRRQPWGEKIFLIALTGWGQDDDKQRTQDAGFNYHLTKPAEPAEIQQILNDLEEPADLAAS